MTIDEQTKQSKSVPVVGAGLAGCEAAFALAERGVRVRLLEMRPGVTTPAHKTGLPAELVCSNSLRSGNPENAPGLLKEEMRLAGSRLMRIADSVSVPAGDALAVDRTLFSAEVKAQLDSHPLISIEHREVVAVPPGPCIAAPGPLASPAFSEAIRALTGGEHLYFYDAIAPILDASSVDMGTAFPQSRYDKGEGADYLNCPMDEDTYRSFVSELRKAERIPPRPFERELHFQGCQPVEAIADTGVMSLAHGPMKPVGITDPRTGSRPFAVVQLRRENSEGTAWNMVGFQTKLTQNEQKRVFSMIPGLSRASFLRLGSVHRNTFVNGPEVLDGFLRMKNCPALMLCGQITGVEGYIESIATGLLAGIFMAELLSGREPVPPPENTALGALLRHVTVSGQVPFQPSNIHYGLFPPVRSSGGRRERRRALSGRALESLRQWLSGSF
jgi:methylenetetrahydrofolate--tRNA-(uracil-5-)-methyltransferase